MRALGIGPAGTLMATGVLEERDPILLADFENRTTDSALGTTITEALRIDISQSQVVRLVDPATVAATLRRMGVDPTALLDEGLGRQVARREGLKAVLTGEVALVGRGYMLSTRLISPADGAVLAAERKTAADDGDLISAIERLSRAVRERIGESLKGIRASPRLAQVTTPSTEALHLYSDAVRAFDTGDQRRTINLLERALDIDSAFAMAYHQLGVLYANQGRRGLMIENLTKAFQLREHLPNQERFHAEGVYYANVVQNDDSAIAAYQRAIDLDPFDSRALNNLGVRFNSKAQFDQAELLFERALEIYPNLQTYNNLAFAQIWQGKLDAAEATAERGVLEFPDSSARSLQSRLGYIAYLRGDYSTALSRWESQRARALDQGAKASAASNISWLWAVQGKVAASRPHFRESAEIFVRERFRSDYLQLSALRARFEAQVLGDRLRAERRVQEALVRVPLDSLDVSAPAYLYLADFYIGIDSLARAEALLAQFEAANDPAAQRWRRLLLEGTIALQEGRGRDAVRQIRASARDRLDFDRHVVVFPELGRAYEAVGQVDSAIGAYERATERRGEQIAEDALWRPFVLKRLGELYQERGDREKAIRYYNEFVELWQDADEQLQPQVREIRQRLARLVGEP
jgi:tetratricopeptide (TPR) repeat protein